MALVPQRLEALLVKQIPSEFKKVLPDSKPTPDQAKLAKAIASGTVLGLVGATGTIVPTGFLGSVTVGLLGITEAALSDRILSTLKGKFGQSGVALQGLCNAIARSVAFELSFATIAGTDAGMASNFRTLPPAVMAKQMGAEAGWPPNENNEKLFLGISEAISLEILEKGYCVIPPAAIGSGGGIAIIS